MSKSKPLEQLVYMAKNIRKNFTLSSRPISTRRSKFFASRRFLPLAEGTSQLTPAHNTLQLRENTYINNGQSPERNNSKNFIKACQIESSKENKIRSKTIPGRVRVNDENDMGSFVDALIDSNIFFQKLEKTMVESLCLIGVRKKYDRGHKMDLSPKFIGFVLYGKVRMFDKDMSFVATRGDTLGEHQFFQCKRSFELKFVDDSAILWIDKSSYSILRQETVRQGFRHQFNRIDTQFKLSFIKKKIPRQ